MKSFLKKLIILSPLVVLLATIPMQKGFCSCAVEGGVCGESPNWEQCCATNETGQRLKCQKEDEADEYGTCIIEEEE